MLYETMNDDEVETAVPSLHLGSLRNEARGALMARKRADARVLLGRLVAISGDADDARNLEVLVDSVNEEVAQYIRKAGDICERLRSGVPLAVMQAELEKAIPHWRAFTNDLPGLAIARDGLPAHEDPDLKRKLGELEKKLAEGAVEEVLAAWIDFGQPEAAAKGVFVQILNAFAGLVDAIQNRNWREAKQGVVTLKQLLETEDGIPFQNGCLSQITALEDRLRWELLLMKCDSLDGLTSRERNKLHVDLTRADHDIEFRIKDTPALEEIQTRIKTAIEDISTGPVEEASNGITAKLVIAILVLIVLVLMAFWLYFRSTQTTPTTSHLELLYSLQFLTFIAESTSTVLLNIQ